METQLIFNHNLQQVNLLYVIKTLKSNAYNNNNNNNMKPWKFIECK